MLFYQPRANPPKYCPRPGAREQPRGGELSDSPTASGHPQARERRVLCEVLQEENLKFDDVVEVDGILLNHNVVVINEVKNSPSLKNVAKCANRGLLFECLLRKIAATPDDYRTEPKAVRDELVKWMTDAQSPAVELMMSGYYFSTVAQKECRARSIHPFAM